MRDYRHTLMGQEHGPSPLAQDRSEPQVPWLYRDVANQLYEIVAVASHYETGIRYVVYRKYKPNGEKVLEPLESFMSQRADGDFKFTREY